MFIKSFIFSRYCCIYKIEFNPFDIPLRRKLASLNAMLSLADITFQEIRDYQNKLQKELEDRFYTELSFGTAGMRGVLGAGMNRMNK